MTGRERAVRECCDSARGWDAEYPCCVVCSTQSASRPHVDEGLCVECYAACYGATGLADVPPEWATEEGRPMTATAFVCAGWFDADGAHHRCETPHPKPQAKGRCGRCYQREYAANGGKVGPASRVHLAVVPDAPQDAPACQGWTDALGASHACQGHDGPPVEGGRCARCARLERGANTARRVMAREDDRPTLADALPAETVTALGTIAEPEGTAPEATPAPRDAPAAPDDWAATLVSPAPPPAPILRAQHVRPITACALVCPNCGETLAMGSRDALTGRAGETLACRDCGAAWQIGAATFEQSLTERAARAS